jgi:hypothetical protein
VVNRLLHELANLTHVDRKIAVRKCFHAVQLAQEKRNRATKEWLIALRVLRKIAGGPTFVMDGQQYQIRMRDGKPFICVIEHSQRVATH